MASKHNPSETIKARHIKRTVIQNGKESPVEMTFTQKGWDALGSVRIDGKLVPKQGFVRISDVQDPPEAKTPPAPPANQESIQTGVQENAPANQATAPEAPKQPTPPVQPATGLDNIEQAIKAGETEKLPMALLLNYVKAKNLAIEAPEKMPQHELIAKIQSLLA